MDDPRPITLTESLYQQVVARARLHHHELDETFARVLKVGLAWDPWHPHKRRGRALRDHLSPEQLTAIGRKGGLASAHKRAKS